MTTRRNRQARRAAAHNARFNWQYTASDSLHGAPYIEARAQHLTTVSAMHDQFLQMHGAPVATGGCAFPAWLDASALLNCQSVTGWIDTPDGARHYWTLTRLT